MRPNCRSRAPRSRSGRRSPSGSGRRWTTAAAAICAWRATEAEVATIRALVDRQRAEGLDLEFLATNEAVRSVAPAISEHVLAASFCPATATPIRSRRRASYAQAATRKGCVVREGLTVETIRVDRGRVMGVDTNEGFVPAAA